MQCFALRVVVVGVGKIPVQLESGERICSRPELTTLVRTSKVSGGLVNMFAHKYLYNIHGVFYFYFK